MVFGCLKYFTNDVCMAAIRTSCHMFVFYLLCKDELSPSSESSIAGYSSVNTKSLDITPTTTPRPICMCNMSDCVCCT